MTGPAWIPQSATELDDGRISVHWRAGVGRHRDIVIHRDDLPRVQRVRQLHGYPPMELHPQPLEAS